MALPPPNAELVDRVLRAVSPHDGQAADELLPLVYDELRELAEARLARTPPGQTLQATALVHEAWLRVVGDADPGWDCRAHFFAAAARAMRNILVDQARRKGRLKHGGGRKRVAEGAAEEPSIEPPMVEMAALDEALRRLEARDPRKARIVELRFFTGLTMAEVAEVMEMSLSRVEAEWRFARSWLQREVAAP